MNGTTSPATVLTDEAQKAWAEYLANTQGVEHMRYLEIEPWAWARLKQKLKVATANKC